MSELVRIHGAGGGGGKGGGGGTTHVPTEAPDSLRSRAYARVVDLISEGEIEGLVDGLRSIYLDDTPLQATDGSYNFSGVTVVTRNGTQSQAHIPGFAAVESEIAVATEVKASTPVVRSISNVNLSAVRVTISVPQLTYQDPSTGDLRGAEVAYAVDVDNNGSGFEPVKLSIQPNALSVSGDMASSGTREIIGATVGIRWQGSADPDAGWQTIISAAWLLQYRRLPSGVWTSFASGYVSGSAQFDGSSWIPPEQTASASVSLEEGAYEFRVLRTSGVGTMSIDFATGIGWTEYDILRGKTTSRYQRSHRIDLPAPGPWQVRVRRITPDSTQSNLRNQTYWDSYTEIIDAKLRYPNSALVAIQIDAAQFNRIPRRGYDIRGLRVKVPTNYNPITRSYSGTWDGTFKIAWTDNPAWCFYDLLTNTRYGLGAYLDPSQVDKWALYEIGRYCDELVPDGFGGMEPRFTCNLYMQTRQEAYTVLQQMAAIFRGMAWWSQGAITAVADMPADPVALFTEANVIDGTFTYSGSSVKQRHTVALVTWNDPSDMYRQKIEYVEDVEGIRQWGVRETEIVAVGCTSRGQAHRIGRWLLYTERMETETVTFRAGLDGALVYPGAVIRIQDASRAGVRFGGRVKAATSSSITLDAPVTIEAGKTYSLSCMLPDGTVETRAVSTGVGTHTALAVSPAFSAAPLSGAIWVLAASDLSPTTWRVIAVQEVETGIVEITALAHRPDKYGAIENNLVLEPIRTTAYGITAPDAPTNLTLSESLYLAALGVVAARAEVSWDAVLGAVGYEVSWRIDGGNPATQTVTTPAIEIAPAAPGSWEVSVRAVDALGRRSAPATLVRTLYGKTAPPADVTGLALAAISGHAHLTFDPAPDLDVVVGGYLRVRHSPLTTGASWQNAIDIGIAIPGSATSAVLPLISGTYLAKWVDSSGNESVNAVAVITDAPDVIALNVVETLIAQPTWTGTRTSTWVDQGALRLDSAQTIGQQTSNVSTWPRLSLLGGVAASGEWVSEPIDLGAVYTSRLTALLEVQTIDEADTIGARTDNVSLWPSVVGQQITDATATLYVRTTNDDPSGSPTWSPWQSFAVADWTARGYQFRLVLETASSTHSIRVPKLEVTIDMPDRIEQASGVISGTGTKTITFSPPFKALKALAITAENMASGDYYQIANRSNAGFDITFRDSAGNPVSRSFDWIAKGY